MTPDLSRPSGFARGLLSSLHVRDTCLHSGSWLLSGFAYGELWRNLDSLLHAVFASRL